MIKIGGNINRITQIETTEVAPQPPQEPQVTETQKYEPLVQARSFEYASSMMGERRGQMAKVRSKHDFQLNAKQKAALLMAGFRLYNAGRLFDARRIFKGLAVLDPKNVYVLGILGSIDQKEKKFYSAIDRYSEALALYPGDPNLLANRGESYLKVGKIQNAAVDFKKAIDLDQDKKHPASNRARLLVHAIQAALEIAKEKGVGTLHEQKTETHSS